MINLKLFQIFFIIFLLVSLNIFANSKYEVLDKIIAIAEKEAITQTEFDYDLNRALEFNKINNITNSNLESIERDVLDNLIKIKIITQYAKKQGLTASFEEIDFVIQDILKSNQLTIEEFIVELSKNNTSLERFKNKIAHNLTIKKLKGKEIMPYINVSKFEIDAWLKKQRSQQKSEYKIFHILIKSDSQKKEPKIKNILAKVNSQNFQDIAREFSEGPYSETGGDLGWNELGSLPSLFADVIPNMSLKEIKKIESSNGTHFIMLDEIKNKVKENKVLIPEYKFQQIIIKKNSLVTEDEVWKKLEKIKMMIVNGMLFEDAMKRYSEDTLQFSSENLKWINVQNLLPTFKEKLNNYPQKDLIGPFKTELGWHLIKVYDYRESDITNESDQEIARIEIAKMKAELRFEDWLNSLIEKSKIQIINE